MSTRSSHYLCLAASLVATTALVAGRRATNPRPGAASVTSAPQCFKPSAKISLSGRSCGPVPDLQLSCYLPADMAPSLSPASNFNTLQREADVFSWQEFLALNWPARAGERGEPDVTKRISAPGPRVWETWKEESEIYLNGVDPKPWNTPERDGKLLFRTQKIDDAVDATLQAAAADGTLPATLTDQKYKLVRYEIRLNKVLFDYVVGRKLYNADSQALAKSVNFPDGAMLVKAAWREVSPVEANRFHTVMARVCDRDNGTMVNCRSQRVGLVGLHITQKTPSAPQWIWSTFEQVNNVPDSVANAALSFYDPHCPMCWRNRQTAPGKRNQIVRAIPIPGIEPDCAQPMRAVDNVRLLNGDVRRALDTGSVFQNYQLVNTQWPVPHSGGTLRPSTVFSVRPFALGNTTMESFVQSTSTCMGCHSTARTVNATDFVSADFSFTLNNALPAQRSCKVIPPPVQARTPWDRQHWTEIMRGYSLATRTYESLPAFVPTAKLHCSSCHLAAGGNSDAAWWVDLRSEYPTTDSLQWRINKCFTKSLNGIALCTAAVNGQKGTCDNNRHMDAILKYMQWLDHQATSMRLCNTVKHGYPGIKDSTADTLAGRRVFVQKCAVCHGLDGAGRYASNTYFRPALWGRHSFNESAGMFSEPKDLARFVRWNMPLMAGGALTDSEAWNVEAYIHTKPRPPRL